MFRCSSHALMDWRFWAKPSNMEQTFSLSTIRRRANDARKAMAEAERLAEAARAELDDLIAAEHILIRLIERPSVVQSTEGESLMAKIPRLLNALTEAAEINRGTANPYKADTNKALFYRVLSDSAQMWMNANEIQEAASSLKGSDIPMSSVSPGLSEMKNDDVIERDGLRVALKRRLKVSETEPLGQQKLFGPASPVSNQEGGDGHGPATTSLVSEASGGNRSDPPANSAAP